MSNHDMNPNAGFEGTSGAAGGGIGDELRERLANAADEKIDATITWPEDTEAVVSYSPREIVDAILSDLRAAGYAVVRRQCTMGVGTGDGLLFVHGDYDSIKAAQAIVLAKEAAEAEVAKLREALDEIAYGAPWGGPAGDHVKYMRDVADKALTETKES